MKNFMLQKTPNFSNINVKLYKTNGNYFMQENLNKANKKLKEYK